MNANDVLESIQSGKIAGINQNPQPTIFSQTMDVDSTTTSRLTELVHEMGASEHMKLYSIMAIVIPQSQTFILTDTINDGGLIPVGTQCWASGYTDMNLSIYVGNNMIPHRAVDLAVIDATNSHEIVLPTPIFVEWSQRLYIKVQNNDAQAAGTAGAVGPPIVPGSVSRVKITLVGEIVDEEEIRRRLTRQMQAKQQ